MFRPPWFLLALVAVFAVAIGVAEGLRGEPVKDEVHFSQSAQQFAGPFGVDALRSYPEVVTPLALVVWGQLEHLTGNGIVAGRALNVVAGFALVCLIAFATRTPWRTRSLAAVGLLAFPYTLPLAVHLYTDMLGALLGALGVFGLLRGRLAWACVAFVLAISTRQYLVVLPAAFGAEAGLAALRGHRERWPEVAACAVACASLLAWFAFFGGMAPQAGMDEWLPQYPAPMTEALSFILHYGSYVLVGLGMWFVVVEAFLYRVIPPIAELLDARGIALAVGLAVLFALDPPFLSEPHPGGAFGRVSRMVFPVPTFDVVRIAAYFVLALLAVWRFFRRLDAAFWLVLATVVLSMKQQIPWEKYLLPTLTALWLLRADGRLAGWLEEAPDEAEEPEAAPSTA